MLVCRSPQRRGSWHPRSVRGANRPTIAGSTGQIPLGPRSSQPDCDLGGGQLSL